MLFVNRFEDIRLRRALFQVKKTRRAAILAMNGDPAGKLALVHLLGAAVLRREPGRGWLRSAAKVRAIESELGPQMVAARQRVNDLFEAIKGWRERPLDWVQAELSEHIWECATCSRFFWAESKRQHRYCSRACFRLARSDAAKRAVNRSRKAEHAGRLRRVQRAVGRFRNSANWKARAAIAAGVTKNWISYAVKRGEITAPGG